MNTVAQNFISIEKRFADGDVVVQGLDLAAVRERSIEIGIGPAGLYRRILRRGDSGPLAFALIHR